MQHPSAADLPSTDDGYRLNLLGDLQLDQDDEPKRGASRANSVRFDERVIQAHWAHGSRSSGDLFPLRTGSGLGNHHHHHHSHHHQHATMERSSSGHKSDGRHSSAGHSIHSSRSTPSARANSVGLDGSFSLGQAAAAAAAAGSFDAAKNQPGLALLGPVPSIIRCWIDDSSFSNDTLVYAAICTGSYGSFVALPLARRLDLLDRRRGQLENGVDRPKIAVHLAEASVLSSPRSDTDGVPAITVEFTIVDQDEQPASAGRQVEVFLGSDALRAHNADVLFSQNVMTLIGDGDRKLSVPLVRPEDDNVFKCLYTACSVGGQNPEGSGAGAGPESRGRAQPTSAETTTTTTTTTTMMTTGQDRMTGSREKFADASVDVKDGDDGQQGQRSSSFVFPKGLTANVNGYVANSGAFAEGAGASQNGSVGSYKESSSVGREPDGATPGRPHSESMDSANSDARPTAGEEGDRSANTSSPQRAGNSSAIWGLWRREPGQRSDGPSASTTTGSGYQRPGRSRGTKVLRPSKSSISSSRSYSTAQAGGAGASNVEGTGGSSGGTPSQRAQATASGNVIGKGDPRRSTSGELKAGHAAAGLGSAGANAGSSQLRSNNPVGDASAFAWLNGSASAGGSVSVSNGGSTSTSTSTSTKQASGTGPSTD